MDGPPARQAIQRKPLPRNPTDPRAENAPPPYSPAEPRQASPPALQLKTTGTGLDQRLGGLHLCDEASAGSVGGVGMPPRRQETTLTSASSNAPTWASSSSTWTADTEITTPTTAGVSTPGLPERPSRGAAADAAVAVEVGQFGPGISSSEAAATSASDGKAKEPSFWKTALDETRFFAAGLVHKPFESTKHYTILRHSAGLVMYRGPSTSVVVTVFSTPDHPVPADRTVWLQRRGFTGDTGLKLKTLVGASGSWLDVTPARPAAAADLPAADERGYQRDINKFLKKAKSEKALASRRPRETLVVRIPAAAADGYFRLVLCTGGVTTAATAASGMATPPAPGGAITTTTTATASATTTTTKRKVLCGSPVFRIASTSTDASIFRGASLTTLPMEAGVKIASMLGTHYVSNAAAPVVSAVQSQVQKYQPGMIETMAAQSVYGQSGLQAKVDKTEESYDESRQRAYSAYDSPLSPNGDGSMDDAPPEVVGPDSGPEKPFPLRFQGRVVRGTGRSAAELGVPTANLADVPDDVRMRLRGVYFGWATVMPPSKDKGGSGSGSGSSKAGTAAPNPPLNPDWIEAVVTVGPSQWGPAPGKAAAAVVTRHDVAVHLLYDFGPAAVAALVDCKIKVILMGFLRPIAVAPAGAKADRAAAANNDDALVVVTSLSRPHWGPQATLDRIASDKSGRSLSDKYVDTRGRLQKQVDKIPFHLAGVRTPGGELRDQLYGNGGFWIPR